MNGLPLQRLTGGALPRQRQAAGYAALVIAGHYSESGDAGRFIVSAGDVLVHRAFEAHHNWVPSWGAVVLNVPLGHRLAHGLEQTRALRPLNMDALINAARDDSLAFAGLLLAPAWKALSWNTAPS